jgi:hypothetical protein
VRLDCKLALRQIKKLQNSFGWNFHFVHYFQNSIIIGIAFAAVVEVVVERSLGYRSCIVY